MASVISLGVEVNGESTFDSAIKAMDANIKSLGAQLEAATTAMGGMDAGEESAKKQADLLAASIDAQQQKLGLLNQKYEAAKSRLDELKTALDTARASNDPEAVDKAARAYNDQAVKVSKLETQMAKAETAIGKATAAMEGGAQAADQSGAAMSGAATGAGTLEAALGKMSTMMTVEFVGKAAKAVLDTVQAIAQKCADAGKAILNLTAEAGTYADTILTLSSQTGVDPIDLQKWQYAGNFIDTDTDTLVTAMRKITTAMTSGSETSAAAFEQLGVATTDADGNLRSAKDVMFDTIDALGDVSNATERDALAMTLMGKGAQALNPIIEAGSAAFLELGEHAEAAGLIMSGDALTAFGDFDDKMQELNASTTAAKNTLAQMFLPLMGELVEKATAVVQSFSALINGTGSSEEFAASIDALITAGVDKLNELLPVFTKAAGTLLDGLLQAFTDPENVTRIGQSLGALAQTIGSKLPEIAESLLNIGAQIAGGLIAGILGFDSTQDMLDAVTSWIAGVGDSIKALWEDIKAKGATFLGGIWEGLKSAPALFVSAVTGWVTEIGDAITKKWEDVKTKGSLFFAAIWDGLKGAPASLLAAVTAWIDGIKAQIEEKGVWQTICDVGLSIVNGIVEGVKNAATSLWTGIKDAVSGAIDSVKAFFGIHSPSTYMRDQVGVYLGLGIAEGITASAGAIDRAMQGVMPDARDYVRGADGYSVAASVASGSGSAANPFRDERPIILRLNDRELGRAVRGYA